MLYHPIRHKLGHFKTQRPEECFCCAHILPDLHFCIYSWELCGECGDTHHELFSVYFTSHPFNVSRINISQALLTWLFAISFCFHQLKELLLTV